MSYLTGQILVCGVLAYLLGLLVGLTAIWVASVLRTLRKRDDPAALR